MSRRSRRELRRGGRESDVLANRRLPRPHEIVPRSVADLEDYTSTRRARLDWPESRPLPGRFYSKVVRSSQRPVSRPLFRGGYDARSLLTSRAFDVFPSRLRPLALSQVRFCVQRKIRREVLWAKGVAGRRGIGKRVRRSAGSFFSCR